MWPLLTTNYRQKNTEQGTRKHEPKRGRRENVHLRKLEHHLVAEAGKIYRQLDNLGEVLADKLQALRHKPLHL